MNEMTMEDKIFIKQCLDEYNYHAYNNIIPFVIIRRISSAAMKGDELKELSVIMRSSFMNSSSDLYKLFNAYKNKFKPNASLKEIAEEIDKEHLKTMNHECYSNNIPDPFSKAISSVNSALRTIDNQIEFIRASYKVADSNDERFNKATVKSILKEDATSSYNSSWSDIEKIEEELNAKKVDPYSPEYGKLIIKRLNSFKADIISAFNKYFGKNSVFAEFNLSDMIR